MRQKKYTIKQNDVPVFEITITVPDKTSYYDIKWDSKTGLLSACTIQGDESSRQLITCEGNTWGTLSQECSFEVSNIKAVEHYYWYY